MSLRSFVEETGTADRTLAVVDGDESAPLEAMLAETFAEQSLDVEFRPEQELTPKGDVEIPMDGDAVVVAEDDEVIAVSSMQEVYDALLAINSDLFVTGARGLGEIDLPDALAALDEVRFTLRGYPLAHKEKLLAHKEKLLLILVSRQIEQLAWKAGRGTLRSSFQRLSRLDDKAGTREVYGSLAETDVDVHLYGLSVGREDVEGSDREIVEGSN